MINEEVIERVYHKNRHMIGDMRMKAIEGTKNPEIVEIASEASKIKSPYQRQQFVYRKIYNLAHFLASPEDRQQMRSVTNMVREGKANCTGYSILISSVLLLLGDIHNFRLVDSKGDGYDHIYVITPYSTLDAVLGQPQDGTDSFMNRNSNGSFDTEPMFLKKKTTRC